MSLDVQDVVHSLASARRSPGAVKTSTMTFAVLVENEQMAGWVRERVRAVADKHPSRVIIFDALREISNRDVQTVEQRGEWIELGARGANAAELLSALSTLELQSAPVVMLWAADNVANDDRFLSLARHARVAICSSSLTQNDGTGLRDVTAFVNAHPEIALHDIAYLRLASWQELIAEFFDDARSHADLNAIERIDVRAGSDAEMYYILGWLASRLEWHPKGAGIFQSHSREIAFDMHREGPPRRLFSIDIRAGSSRYSACVHPQDQDTICLSVEGPYARPRRCTPLHGVDLASLVERAILASSRDAVFIESLAMASHILERNTA